VAEEHFATATTRLVMARLNSNAACRPANGKTLIAAAVAGNQHDLGVQMVADLFEMDGWRVVQLGANVPAEDLAQAVEFYSANLVALSLSLATQLPTLQEAVSAIRARQRGATVKILVGGCGLGTSGELLKSSGVDGFAADAREAVACGNALVGLPQNKR
jgi:MerR family transcriptional regulator, light-induced transcriptional regulator